MSKISRLQNICACNIHTFETGNFRWSQAIKESADPIETKKGPLGQCHYVERNNITAVGWHIKNENNKYLLESSNFYYNKKDDADSTTPIEGNTKDEYIWIAPAILFKKPSAGSADHTISIQLKTSGPTCNGHRAELVLADRPINKNFPSSASITDTILTEAQFEDKVTAEMTAQNYTACGTLAGDDFSTNNNIITIKTTYTPSATGVKYIGIRDKSNGIDVDYAKLQIHDISIYVSGVDDTDIPTTFPAVTAKIRSDNGKRTGQVELNDKVLGIDCIWCWSNGNTFQNIPPDLKGIKSGTYYLKGVNTKLGYTLPIQKFVVPLRKSASPMEAYPPYSKKNLVKKQYYLYTNSIGGMGGNVHEMMKITILDYLYKILYPQTRPNPLYPDWSQYGEILRAVTADGVYVGSFLPDNPLNPDGTTIAATAVSNMSHYLFPDNTNQMYGQVSVAGGFEEWNGVTGVKSSLTTVVDSLNIAQASWYNTNEEEFAAHQGGVFATANKTTLKTRKVKNELQNLLGRPMTPAQEANWDLLEAWMIEDLWGGGVWVGDTNIYDGINWGEDPNEIGVIADW